jgi:uncharacterized repeat protein (TIGR03803 family)
MKGSKSLLIPALTLAAVTLSLAVWAQAQTVTFLYQFSGQATATSLVQATDGNFYGTGSGGVHGQGQVFRMTPSGELSTIYSFCSQPRCADGNNPLSPLLGSDGNLYGVAQLGGSAQGSGTFYRVTLDGRLTTLYEFCPQRGCFDGQVPRGIMQAGDGNFYGIAEYGGRGTLGTIFRISPSGEFKLLHTFCALTGCTDGGLPLFPPIQGSDGNFYGTAAFGANTAGVFYRLAPDGTYTVLYNFCSLSNCADGYGPNAVVQGANGNFLGTTQFDGNNDGGTIFEITSRGQVRVLHSFKVDHGNIPTYGLTLANDGNFYGSTEDEGFNGVGTLFKITPTGDYTPLYSFGSEGYDPYWGPLFQGTDGNIYGTTLYSAIGDCCNGTIFSLDDGLSPLVETVPVAGRVGQRVIILGNGLTGSTSVTFNGVAAAFTVESESYIKATVPAGATTGTVSVVTRSGTLSSNPQFVVTK